MAITQDSYDLVADIVSLADCLEGTLQEWEQHPRRLTCLRDAEETIKEMLKSIKKLRKLNAPKVKVK